MTTPSDALKHDIAAAKDQADHWQQVADERHQATLRAIAAHAEALDQRDEWIQHGRDLQDLADMEAQADKDQDALRKLTLGA